MSCLVTGGTGFLGSYVVRDLLHAGKEIVCLQRSGVTQTLRDVIGNDRSDRLKIVQGDVGDTVQVFNTIRENKIVVIIHLGFTLPPVSETQPAYALQVNCGGLINMLEAVRLLGVKRLIWTSSSRAFGHVGDFWKEPVGGDDAIYMPEDVYGATKALDEFFLKYYHKQFEVDCIGIRMARTFGIGKLTGGGATLTRFFQNCALDRPAVIGGATRLTPYQYVEDTADLIVKACDVPTTKSCLFNTGEEITNSEMAELVRKVNPQAQVTVEDDRGAGTVAVFGMPPRTDTASTEREIGWQPRYGITGGLRKMFNHFRKQEGMPPLQD